MELTFSALKAKEVVNTQDGRKLGKVCDVVLCYPENKWIGIVAPNGKAFGVKKNGLFIDLRQIVKIGDDVILVNVGSPKMRNTPNAPVCPPCPSCAPGDNRRSFEEYE